MYLTLQVSQSAELIFICQMLKGGLKKCSFGRRLLIIQLAIRKEVEMDDKLSVCVFCVQ